MTRAVCRLRSGAPGMRPRQTLAKTEKTRWVFETNGCRVRWKQEPPRRKRTGEGTHQTPALPPSFEPDHTEKTALLALLKSTIAVDPGRRIEVMVFGG
jgi:hypothetical protein